MVLTRRELLSGMMAGAAKMRQRPPAVTSNDPLLHLLHRATWGPRPDDVAYARSLGYEAWLDEQVQPEQEAREGQQAALKGYLDTAVSPAITLTKLWGQRENETRVLVDYTDVLWLEAQGKKVYCRTTAGETLLVRHTLKQLAERLRPYQFARVHKAYLVNLNHIAEVVPWFSGAYKIRLDDPDITEIPLSRQYARLLKEQTGLF